jgi:hypothetical protein
MILTQNIFGARNFRTYLFFLILFLGGLNFTLAGLSTYFHINLLTLTNTNEISFLPQGLVMLFYGSAALTLAFYLALTIFWNIGSGYNEFLKDQELIRIVRLGFPGKYRKVFLTYEFKDVESVILYRKEGLNPRNNILLLLKDNREIPLFPANYLLNPNKAEKSAIFLANFLRVQLEEIND